MTITTDSLVAGIENHSISNGHSNGHHTSSSTGQKPHLVFTAASAAGHTIPLMQIAEAMVKRGFEVSFVAGPQFADQLKRIGVETHAVIPDMLDGLDMNERNSIPPGIGQLMYDMKHAFIGCIPLRYAALRDHLEAVRAAKPGRQVIVVNETLFMGSMPLIKGAALPKGYDKAPHVVNVNIVPYFSNSIDTAPFGPGLPPDSTPSGRARNGLLNHLMSNVVFAEVNALQAKIFKSLGVQLPEDSAVFQFWLTDYAVTLQMCPPSFEYPRSDLHPSVQFAGAVPAKQLPPTFEYPSWWSDLDGKKVVAVAQGTVAVDYEDLLLPTIRGLADRDDVIVVAILCVRGATLPADFAVPSNTRVIDYFPYDAVLTRADVFVQNGGYGGVLGSMVHGVPLVVAGDTEDKSESTARVEWSGIGVNLRCGKPTPEQVRAGVDEVLADGKYKQRVMEMKRENEAMDPFGAVEDQIRRFTE